MRYETASSFESDYRSVTEAERALFLEVARRFNDAADRVVAREVNGWPRLLRVRAVRGASGVFEMTWSFSGPDGRATWEWVSVTDAKGVRHPAVRWRRIGDHTIFRNP